MHPQTLLAYEMNGEPLGEQHGPPLRLRVENQLGFKMVKWIREIEFVETPQGLRRRGRGLQRGQRILRRTGQHLNQCWMDHRSAPGVERDRLTIGDNPSRGIMPGT